MARQARRAFEQTRAARFGESRARTEQQKAEERAAGTRRTAMLVDLDDVRDGDMVAMTGGGFALAEETDRADWASADGKTFVQRFVATGGGA